MTRTHVYAALFAVVAGSVPVLIAPAAAEEAPAADWRSLSPPELAWLARSLSGDDATVKEARAALADHITATYLDDVAATKSVSPQDWKCFAECLGKELTDANRTTWAERLQGAYAPDQAAVALLKADEVRDVLSAECVLGAADRAATIVEQRIVGGTVKPDELAGLAETLVGLKDVGKAARGRVVKYVTDTVLASPSATRAFDCRNWGRLVSCLQGELVLNTRAAWIARLRAAYDTDALASLKYDDARVLGDALNGLGAWLAYDVLLPCVERSAEWQALKADQLAELAGRLDSLGDIGAKAQLAVAKHVMATCLGSAEIIKAVGLDAWGRLARMGRNLPAESRQTWADAVKGAFAADDAALLQMQAGDVVRLVSAIEPLVEDQAKVVACTWVLGSPLAKTADKGDLANVAGRAVGCLAVPAEKRRAIPTMVESLLSPGADQIPRHEQCIVLMCLWNSVENLGKVHEWTLKAYQAALGSEEAREKVSMGTLNVLAEWLYHSKMIDNGTAYPGFAQALARHGRQGTLATTHPDDVAAVLCTPETRQMLRNELLDTQGSPRPEVAKVLAWAYRNSGEFGQWRSFVEQGLSATDGDAKALWLTVKAFTETLVPDPPNPLRRRRVLDAALAAAVSEPTRLVVLNELADFYRGIHRPGIAADLMESVKQQFSTDAIAAVEAIQVRLRTEEADRQRAQAQAQATAGLVQKGTQLGYYRRCLEQANARGDGQEAARLQTAIQSLERELGR